MENLNLVLHYIHNLLRWAVFFTGLWAIYRAYFGFSKRKAWSSKDEGAGFWFVMSCHTQLLIGLFIYIKDGYYSIFSNMSEGMKNGIVRFWGIEHITGMLLAITLVQFARIASKKAQTDTLKHKKALIWYSIGMFLIIISIPWPWREAGRALFPGF
ncbi:MAG: hypothetical protein HUU47_00460 [Bacteroidetes bacterium]|nr:hypothetical protein [Bacteroidota bacterium]